MADFAFRRGERVAATAIRVDGTVHSRPHARHFEIYDEVKPHDDAKVESGFVTNKGRYVDREEAMGLARKKRQVYSGTNGIRELDTAYLKPAH